jgi:hypothetical protein
VEVWRVWLPYREVWRWCVAEPHSGAQVRRATHNLHGVARSLIVAARLTRCPVVLRATDTYLCNGVCIATTLCCEDTSPDSCPDGTECDGVASPSGATCVCDPTKSCCTLLDADDGVSTVSCPINSYPVPGFSYPRPGYGFPRGGAGYVCTALASAQPPDGGCGCPTGKCESVASV